MDAFGDVLIAVTIVGAIVACVSFLGSRDAYRDIGRSGLSLEDPALHDDPAPGTAAYDAAARAEIRQMLEARAARQAARGETPVDVDAELERLVAASAPPDPSLRREVRELVVAANERRVRRGEPPLEVEPEVDRRLRELGA